MAITITKRPHRIVPAFNDIEFEFSGSNVTSTSESFQVVVTIGSTSYTFNIDPHPTTFKGYFNLRQVAEKHVVNYYPFGLNGWQLVTGGIEKFIVDINEVYGTPPTVHTGSTGNVVLAWNGSLNMSERAIYEENDFVNVGTDRVTALNNLDSITKVKTDQDAVLYFLQSPADYITTVKLITYNSSGTALNSYFINNPYTTLAPNNTYNTTNKYVCINMGVASLTQLFANSPASFTAVTSPVVSSSPLFIGTESYYTCTFYSNLNMTPKTIRFDIDETCAKFYNQPLYYLNRYGAYDWINMYGNHKKKDNITRSTYNAQLNKFEASYTNSTFTTNYTKSPPLSIQRKVLSSTYEKAHTLQSNYLSDFQVLALEDLFTTAELFLNSGYQDYKKLVPTDTTYEFKSNKIDKLINLQLNVNEGITERRQFTND